jgi:nitroreductase
MDILEAMNTRRSIRVYKEATVPKDKLDLILQAAMSAPSAYNQQIGHFIVIQEPLLLQKIAQISPKAYMCAKAPMGILVCGDLAAAEAPSYWVQDCSAITENLLIAVHALEMGAVWTAVYPLEEVMGGFRHLLAIPSHIIPFSFVILGFPAESKEEEFRFQKERIHENGW